jgi:hypothetical protein
MQTLLRLRNYCVTNPKCVGALLARNEAAPDRYLERVLKNAAEFCDTIVVLDDHSTDATRDICLAAPHVVQVESTTTVDEEGWWQGARESAARAHLWRLATQHAGSEGWVYVFDADHELVGLASKDFQELLRAENVNAWACPLWDCWDSDEQMRVDGYWQAHWRPRPWLARSQPHADFRPEFSGRGVHAGHFPANYPFQVGLMPPGTAIRHLGYIKEEARLRKAERYLNIQHA